MKIAFALAAGLLGYFYLLGHSSRSKRKLAQEELHRWEDEGGNLPGA